MIIAKIIGIFGITLIGYGANKIGWLPIESSKYFSSALINLAAPCVTIMTLSGQERNGENTRGILMVFLIMGLGFVASWLIAILFNRLTRVPEQQKGVYKNFLLFTNNGFMGIAIAMTIFSGQLLFLFILMGAISPLFVYTFGTANLKRDVVIQSGGAVKKVSARGALKDAVNAPIISCVVGLALYIFQIPLPEAIGNVLSLIGSMMTPLAMIVIGLQLTESRPRDVIGNARLVGVSLVRLIGIPVIFFFIMLLIRMPAPLVVISTLNFLLPAAVAPVALAEEVGADAKLAAEGTFLSTLFSMATVPVAVVLLHNML